jgi:hypothetical protein
MGKALTFSQTQMFIQENIKKASLMEKANTLGKMHLFISENSSRDSNTVKASGRVAKGLNATSMKGTMQMTRSLAAEFSIGQVEIATRVNTETMKETVSAK